MKSTKIMGNWRSNREIYRISESNGVQRQWKSRKRGSTDTIFRHFFTHIELPMERQRQLPKGFGGHIGTPQFEGKEKLGSYGSVKLAF